MRNARHQGPHARRFVGQGELADDFVPLQQQGLQRVGIFAQHHRAFLFTGQTEFGLDTGHLNLINEIWMKPTLTRLMATN